MWHVLRETHVLAVFVFCPVNVHILKSAARRGDRASAALCVYFYLANVTVNTRVAPVKR